MSGALRQSSHTILVKTLYRQVLKEQLNWAVSREHWLGDARIIRAEFDSAARLADQSAIQQFIERTQKWLVENKHPDPYNMITQVGGTSFQRNAPPSPGLIRDDGDDDSHASHH